MRKQWILAVRLVLLAAICVAPPLSAQELTRLGEQGLYDRFCASCHGPEGRGDGPVAEILAPDVPDLTQLSQRHDGEFPADYVRLTIDSGRVEAHGPRHMPVWGYEFWVEEGADLQATEHALEAIEMLVRHVRGLQE